MADELAKSVLLNEKIIDMKMPYSDFKSYHSTFKGNGRFVGMIKLQIACHPIKTENTNQSWVKQT